VDRQERPRRGAGAVLRLRGEDRRGIHRPLLPGRPAGAGGHAGQRAGGKRRHRNVKTIGAVPLRLKRAVDVAVRGEIFLARSLFATINAKMEEPYANPRNLASGTLRGEKQRGRRHPAEHLPLRGVLRTAPRTHRNSTGAGRPRVPLNPRVASSRMPHRNWPRCGSGTRAADGGPDMIGEFIESERTARESLDYEIDGIVVKADQIAPRAAGLHGAPSRWAIPSSSNPPRGKPP